MDALLEKLLKRLKIEDLSPYEGGSFTKLVDEKESNTIVANILFPKYLPYQAYQEFFDHVSELAALGGFSMRVTFTYLDERENFPRLLEEFKEAMGCTLMDDVYLYETENKVLFYYTGADKTAKLNDEIRKLKDFLDSISSTYKLLIQEKVTDSADFSKSRDESYQEKAKEAYKGMKKQEAIDSTYQPCKLKDIENFRLVIVVGTIFYTNDYTKQDRLILRTLELYDGSDSVSVNLFVSKKMSVEEITQYVVGVKVRIFGSPFYDERNGGQVSIRVDKIEKLDPDPLREDTAPEKRIELHLHTKMSAMDGVCDFEDYAKTAKRWGHEAIAITDHGVVHEFPEAEEIGKKVGIKVIYGTEMYMVDDTPRYIFNPDEKRALKDTTYVVFDIETTGLSARYDRLIEFGAVKIDAFGTVLDEVDFFVNPERKLSWFSMNVSNITQEQVDHGKNIRQALRDIKEFFGDSIIVAHNAGGFDYEFLNEVFRNNQMETIKNPVIDTLPLSLFFYPKKKSHREGAMARELGIQFDEVSAHRANYDALILSKIFQIYLSYLTKDYGCVTHADIGKLPYTDEMIVNTHPDHVTCYVKNQQGLKDLYRLISESETKYLSFSTGNPLIPKSHLAKYRENLLIGSACMNGEVFEAAMIKSTETLMERMKFYDMIEVQPPENYVYLVNHHDLSSSDDVKGILSHLINTARDMHKIVCATGDCHYLDPEDKIYRDIYIATRGLNKSRHPLNLAPSENDSQEKKRNYYRNRPANPDQHFRTTDEMLTCFSFLNDERLVKEIVIDNPKKISDMISPDIEIVRKRLYPPKIEGNEKLLTDLVYKTAQERYGSPLPEPIASRIEKELSGIISHGYSVIYWISSLLVRWANDKGYLIGSRGSVGSSLVATLSGITEVNPLPPHYICPECHHLEWADPIKYGSGYDLPPKDCPECGTPLKRDGQNIPFETFLGFKADKVPDIDLNIPSDFQSAAQEHLKDLLGADCVFKAGTIETVQDQKTERYVEDYLISIGQDQNRVRRAEKHRLALGCLGVKNTTGQHPGGVIAIPSDMEVYDFTPIQYPAGKEDAEWKTTHFDYHKIEPMVLKFDMLGHVDPQAVKMMCDLCSIPFTQLMDEVPLNDPEALSIFWSIDALHLKKNLLNQQNGALGLPEFGTPTGRKILLETKPRCYADLVKISGLSHGTNVYEGNARDLIMKDGLTLNDVITCRDDIMLTLHEKYGIDFGDSFKIAELVRKSGNFGKPAFKADHDRYVEIMRAHGVPEYFIQSCEKIQYLYPKAHAVAYVNMAVRCAYFKVHHPLEYYATYFTLRCDAYELKTMCGGVEPCLKRLRQINDNIANNRAEKKEKDLIDCLQQTIEMYDRGYSFGKLSVNHSSATNFMVDEKRKRIIPAFSAVNGMGASVSQQIVQAREQQPFSSIEDLQRRAKISDKNLESLRELGALDELPESDQLTLF